MWLSTLPSACTHYRICSSGDLTSAIIPLERLHSNCSVYFITFDKTKLATGQPRQKGQHVVRGRRCQREVWNKEIETLLSNSVDVMPNSHLH